MPPESATPERKLKIGIFVALLPPDTVGGTELQADRLMRELAARGHEVHVFARRQNTQPSVQPPLYVHRRPALPIPGLRVVGEVLLGAWQALRVRPDVNLCLITFNSGLIGWVTRLLGGPPFVIWVKGVNEVLLERGGWRSRMSVFLYQRATRVWLQAETLVKTLVQQLRATGRDNVVHDIESRLRVAGNGIDIPTPDADDAPASAPYVFVGRLVREKEIPTLLEATRRVPQAAVTLVGDGPEKDALLEQSEALRNEGRVTFLGAQPRERIPEILRNCRALVLCSSEEGIPNVVLEALAHGRPVIATPVGAVPELVQDGVNGLLVPVGDAEALAEAMQRMRDDETWRRLAANAQRSVKSFGWPALVHHVETELYDVVQPKL